MGEARGAGRCEQSGRPGMPTEAGSATGAAADMTGACGVGKIKRDLSAHCVLCDGGGMSSARTREARRRRRPCAGEQRPGWRGGGVGGGPVRGSSGRAGGGRRQYRAMAEDGAAPGMGEARGAGRCEQNGRPGMPTEAGSATGAAADMTGACGVGKIKRDLSAHCVLCDGGGWSSVRAGGGRRGRRPRAREQRPGWRGRRPRAREQRPGWRGRRQYRAMAEDGAAPGMGEARGAAKRAKKIYYFLLLQRR